MMHIHSFDSETLLVAGSSRGNYQLPDIDSWFLSAVLNISLRKIYLRYHSLPKLLDVKFCISVKIESSDDGDHQLIAGCNAHFIEISLQVFRVNVLIVPIIDLAEETLQVKIVASIQLLFDFFLPPSQLELFVNQLCQSSLDIERQEFFLCDRVSGSLSCNRSQIWLVTWQKHLEITSR